jgi:hypothetical protein
VAIQVSVKQLGGQLLVYAKSGDHAAIIDHIILSIDNFNGWSSLTWFYQEDFYFGSGEVYGGGWEGLMVEMNYSGGPANVHATADYWEVDQRVKSPIVTIT